MKKGFSYFICLISTSFFTECSTLSTPRKIFPAAPGTTSKAENLTRETNDPSQESYPSISPDGRYLLYNAVETTSSLGMSANGSITQKTDRKSMIVKKHKELLLDLVLKIKNKELEDGTNKKLRRNFYSHFAMDHGCNFYGRMFFSIDGLLYSQKT